MKFRDIQQFTSEGSYRVQYPIDHLIQWIEEQEREYDLQLNPDFQRGHVWTEEQQVSWLEFFLRGGRSGDTLYFNDPNWLAWTPEDSGYKDFVCVDGLQRITAIRRFLNDEIKVFGHYYSEFEDPRWLRSNANITINVNNLKTRKEVLKWYIDMNSGGTPHSEAEINRVTELIKDEDGREEASEYVR